METPIFVGEKSMFGQTNAIFDRTIPFVPGTAMLFGQKDPILFFHDSLLDRHPVGRHIGDFSRPGGKQEMAAAVIIFNSVH